MGMKFLNKKGWHTGSLRNIENVWKAEQKHEAEQKKLEELKKQIHEERERAEFRQLQEQAGLIPKQERLDFLYESGLAVGKGSSSFKALESLPKTDPETTASSSASVKQQQQPAVPGALFEEKEKPQSANDAWRKLHSDPLLMIRQREQEALARVKNNPVQMAMIRKSVESKKDKDKDEKKQKSKHHKKKSKHRKHSSSENDSDPEDAHLAVEKQRERHQKGSNSDKPSHKATHDSDEESSKRDDRRKKYYDHEYKHRRPSEAPNTKSDPEDAHLTVEKQRERHQKGSNSDKPSRKATHDSDEELSKRDDRRKKYDDHEYKHRRPSEAPNTKSDPEDAHLAVEKQRERHQKGSNSDKPSRKANHDSDEEYSKRDDRRKKYYDNEYKHRRPSEAPNMKYDRSEGRHEKPPHITSSDKPPRNESNNRHRKSVKLSEEERAARLREMQMDAERHEQQRWKRLKKAADSDAQETIRDNASMGRNFLDAAQKSVFGAEKGGSSTIEESVRRRTHYSQGKSASESNAFRR